MSRFLILALDRDVTLVGEIRFHPDQTIRIASEPDAVGVIAVLSFHPKEATAKELAQLLEEHEAAQAEQEGVAA